MTRKQQQSLKLRLMKYPQKPRLPTALRRAVSMRPQSTAKRIVELTVSLTRLLGARRTRPGRYKEQVFRARRKPTGLPLC